MTESPACVKTACWLFAAGTALDFAVELSFFASGDGFGQPPGPWFALKLSVYAGFGFLVWKTLQGSRGARDVVVKTLFVLAPLSTVLHAGALFAGAEPAVSLVHLLKWTLLGAGAFLLVSKPAKEWFSGNGARG